MRRCYLIRHAQTDWNRDNRLQGHSDLPLSSLGQQQARRLGAYFASLHLQAVFTSALQRSQETARAIVAGNGHQVHPAIEEELAEMHLGVWEGLTPEEIDARFDGAYQRWKTRPSEVVIPQGERLEAFRARARRALQKIVLATPEGNCVVVSHGGVIAAILADVLSADYDTLIRRLQLDNAGITVLEWAAGLPRVERINSTVHLDGAGAVSPALSFRKPNGDDSLSSALGP